MYVLAREYNFGEEGKTATGAKALSPQSNFTRPLRGRSSTLASAVGTGSGQGSAAHCFTVVADGRGLSELENHEIHFSICGAVSGAGYRGDGVGIDRHAVRHSWPGSRGTGTGGADTRGGGAQHRRTWTANVNRAAVLQSADSGGPDHVAAAAAGDEGAARMAGSRCAESGTDARGASGCDGTERARGGVEHSQARVGSGIDGGGGDGGN